MKRCLFFLFSLFLLFAVACREGEQQRMTPVSVPAATLPPGAGEREGRAPKPAASPTALPSPTRVEERVEAAAEWTILVYLAADNDLEGAALQELDEMEQAGASDSVHVLVQIDRAAGGSGASGEWTETRRYLLQEGGAEQPGSLPAELGEVNMGEAASLADFIEWGIESYPAQRYALLFWGNGGGWQGLAQDHTDQDLLSLPELASGLEQGLAAAGEEQLDIVAFEGGLMGQMEVYEAVRPYAHYAVASEELVPGQGRDYTMLLADLYASPKVDGRQWGEQMVRDFGRSYAGETPELFVTMSLVDLQAFAGVTEAVEGLAAALLAEPVLVAGAVSDARSAAEQYALFYPAQAEAYAAVDLGQFATFLARRSPQHRVRQAAQQVTDAVEQAVIAQAGGSGLRQGSGISFYFPRSAAYYQEAYGLVADGSWNQFLSRYHQMAPNLAATPGLNITQSSETAGAQEPAYLAFELSGRDVADVFVIGGRREADDRLRLVTYERLLPEPTLMPDGSEWYEWRDGVHEDFYIWTTMAPYLSDGANGDFVMLWPTAPGSSLYAVRGRFQRAAEESWQEAVLLFDRRSQSLESVWSEPDGTPGQAPREIFPQAGDRFQVTNVYQTVSEQWVYEPGVGLTFSDTVTLDYQLAPLPIGEYALGFSAETASDERVTALTDVRVVNERGNLEQLAYLDPYLGFQFYYPAGWQQPVYEQGQLTSGDSSGESALTLSLYPRSEADRLTATDLKEQTLELFGAVDVLYEETVFVAEMAGLLTAYGYESESGDRTGLFLTFTRENMGYVLDVDGPLAAEAEMITIMDQLISSWSYRPVGSDLTPGNWITQYLDSFTLAVPATYEHEQLSNGWDLFKTAGAFVALRRDGLSGRPLAGVVEHWLEVAARGVNGFVSEEREQQYLAGHNWTRAEFEYMGEEGMVRGFVMATVVHGQEVVAWAEAPADSYQQFLEDVFLVVVADATAGPEESRGLLYEARFEKPNAWGMGQMSGASGGIAAGAYQMEVTADQGFFWTTAGQRLSDGVYEVETVQAAGPLDSGYGLLLLADTEAEQFYVFEISSDGYAWLGYCQAACEQKQTLLGEGWFSTAAVRQGLDATNQLRVIVSGSTLHFFVNGEALGQVVDESLAAGDVGLFVETLGDGGVIVTFDDVRVSTR